MEHIAVFICTVDIVTQRLGCNAGEDGSTRDSLPFVSSLIHVHNVCAVVHLLEMFAGLIGEKSRSDLNYNDARNSTLVQLDIQLMFLRINFPRYFIRFLPMKVLGSLGGV